MGGAGEKALAGPPVRSVERIARRKMWRTPLATLAIRPVFRARTQRPGWRNCGAESMPFAEAQGYLTDEDVFRDVS